MSPGLAVVTVVFLAAFGCSTSPTPSFKAQPGLLIDVSYGKNASVMLETICLIRKRDRLCRRSRRHTHLPEYFTKNLDPEKMNKSFPVVFLLLSVHQYSGNAQFLGVPSPASSTISATHSPMSTHSPSSKHPRHSFRRALTLQPFLRQCQRALQRQASLTASVSFSGTGSGGITKCVFSESISDDDLSAYPDEFPGSGGSSYGHSVGRCSSSSATSIGGCTNIVFQKLCCFCSFAETEHGEVTFPEISTAILEKICQYFYWSLQYASGKETEFHIEPELTLELMMAANYLHT
ncbi:transcription elongation factor B polypeptide [Striga asiatica]|uniref:Elongin-C n=1 Tax=Striga asiatica TaxID=4170 RepID=A0A5A7NYX8_STRAF|nr:transcription elongation factor B polypeptide [Striga asiatica]